MADVIFEEEKSPTGTAHQEKPQLSFIIGMPIKLGWVHDETASVQLLGILSIILIMLAIVAWFLLKPSGPTLTPDQFLERAHMQQRLP